MIRITKQTDYGIVLLTHLAAHPERTFSAPELAAETGLPLPMVSKTLKLLAREGLLASHRGVRGGYGLAQAATEITMTRVISALEGPIAITECIDMSGECSHERICPTRNNWQRINRALKEALDRISLAEMAPPARTEPGAGLVQLGRGASAAPAA
jgi:FeS assembly SUF system regulator